MMMDESMKPVMTAFGVLIFLVGLAYILQDLGYFGTRVNMWSVLVALFGLGMIGKAVYCKPK